MCIRDRHVTAAILTNDMHAYNTFEDPDKVHEEVFTEYKIADGRIKMCIRDRFMTEPPM